MEHVPAGNSFWPHQSVGGTNQGTGNGDPLGVVRHASGHSGGRVVGDRKPPLHVLMAVSSTQAQVSLSEPAVADLLIDAGFPGG